ncbi:UDP-2-acetamido-2,6-dideoxy-beta-L-arabino-hexopyranos-4-ulose 3-epimerase and UDP-2-acetamido-2,6-dideoxy-beta-L-lyxo-hexopyranos-4-ulose 4-(Re)-reductase, putative [Geotalea daltonii FRC-32]|uniref:dTDP-4-dehydrorhamnose reductase n=1 Tax=Geotalea daltonii (strain DSM 22248 / JCM 15807 / FRC-32) TaxID=316067 RepID=B9M561_GEODF|nr:SDR family oxidoreductase [Geotalea daltonii]ACM19816.1 UDP-2-acetamido-2,6-dideoxy-beta-L-arabino-hexopyranos-4-ulose 3-epimerase and UDP-2-acetamido-2,6-dideoxy-beta-L-lyxo-hexopyranos-4-ulose 4-(Re)-reductase, putative [Geotalea daltonii FRC-32]
MKQSVLILGATGMLGHTLLEQLAARKDLEVTATVRCQGSVEGITTKLLEKIVGNLDADNPDSVLKTLAQVKPDVVINCIGIIKQLPSAKDPITAITINSLFPHRLAQACKAAGSRLIHISTDCVFSGSKGNYTESDVADATDLYGRTKFLGEVDYPHCVTLRTSIIGHELKGCYSLIDWFLAQEGEVNGYTEAIYTGFPTVEMARIIADYVIPNPQLNGLYQVSSEPISKYELLQLVAKQYNKDIQIRPFHDFHCDRSLDSSRFRNITGYTPPSWSEMVAAMWMDWARHAGIGG